MPGGGLEVWETLEEWIIRELQEELGVVAKIERLLYTAEFITQKNGMWLEFIYLIQNGQDFIWFEEMDATHWFELADYSRESIYDIDVALKPAMLRTDLPEILDSLHTDHFIIRE